jgi:Flp pilus assembly protein TadG
MFEQFDSIQAAGKRGPRAKTTDEIPRGRRWLPLLPKRVLALLRGHSEGQSLVEFALILPMMLLLTTGIMIFGIAMNNYVQLTNAVSVGARTLAVSAQITLDPCATASNAVIAAAPGLNPANLTFTYVLNGVTYSNTTSCASSSLSSGAANNLASGTTASVTATYPLNLSVYGSNFSASNAVLQATSTELVQ